jgi:hypothetical protein
MSEISIPMSLPLDTDGFLRRECPNCERQFKSRPTQSSEESLEAAATVVPVAPDRLQLAPLGLGGWLMDEDSCPRVPG